MRTRLLSLITTLLVVSVVHAEENKATHDELRAMRDGLLAAVNKNDVEGIVGYMETNVVVTWQNAEVSRGREGVRAYYDGLMAGPNRLIQSFSTTVNVDELTILYGDSTGIAFGSSDDHFKLTSGLDLSLKDRWTATVVKEQGRWLIASFHISANVFNNQLLSGAKKLLYWAAPACGIIGLFVGLLIAKRRKAT